jgi:hypothetical protein
LSALDKRRNLTVIKSYTMKQLLIAAAAISGLALAATPSSASPLAPALIGTSQTVPEITSGLLEKAYYKRHRKHYRYAYRRHHHRRYYAYYPTYYDYDYCDDYYGDYYGCGYPYRGYGYPVPFISLGFGFGGHHHRHHHHW